MTRELQHISIKTYSTEDKLSTEGINLLLVEDDKLSSLAIFNMLKRNFRVFSVYNGREAIDAVNMNKYNVICMDINLGSGMSGIEVAQEIRKLDEYKSIPIVAITAYASLKDRDEILSSGFTHYLAKPFTRVDIVTLLHTVLANVSS